jgi:hypothetical protein
VSWQSSTLVNRLLVAAVSPARNCQHGSLPRSAHLAGDEQRNGGDDGLVAREEQADADLHAHLRGEPRIMMSLACRSSIRTAAGSNNTKGIHTAACSNAKEMGKA